MAPVDGSVIVRAATCADAEAICAIYGPIVNGTAISFEELAPDAAEITRRMLAHPRLPWLVADCAGRVVGYAYAAQHRQRAAYRWSADSSVYLDPEHRSRGFGRLLYERLIAEVRELGYVSLFAGIALPNAASVALHEKAGFAALGVCSGTLATSTAAGMTWGGGRGRCAICRCRRRSRRSGNLPAHAVSPEP